MAERLDVKKIVRNLHAKTEASPDGEGQSRPHFK
jgi:hypothetical protein